ncbi:MAG: translation initiation factor IF-2 subunit alpha [Candidatus Bathyarchaeia archaeon]
MSVPKTEWPEVGDLVIGSIQKVTNYGAYVFLDEYEKEGLLHISEVASGWVRNIRSFVREGQKTVLKVLRVDPEKEHVDLSLRRVTKRARREKILAWKKDRQAEGLLRSVSEKLNISIEGVHKKAGSLIEAEFGELYKGLEKTAIEGPEVLLELGVPKTLAVAIAEIVKEKIKLPLVRIKGTLELQCVKPDGVVRVREALLSAQKIKKSAGAKVRVYVVAPPKYRIEVLAEDYKKAERVLEKATETAIKNITKAGGTGTFRRGK